MINDNLLRKYAKLVVCSGVNVQKGQLLVINSQVDSAYFTRFVVEEAYKAEAGEVIVNWTDSKINKLTYEYEDVESLKNVPGWLVDRQQYFIDKGCCFLTIHSDIPGILKSIDPEKLQEVNMARSKALNKFRYYTMSNYGQWCVVAIPNPEWAKIIFPDKDSADGVNALWDAILKSVRIDENNDPVAEWNMHNARLQNHTKLLNDYNFKTLHFTNSLGTDLYVDLALNHIWEGGCDTSKKGVVFNPNMPTEEVFTMPKRDGVNGIVYATKPLNYQGKLIENFNIEFKDGKAINWHAEKCEDALTNLINLDEGSSYLGEVALISNDSPISNLNILFYNTLFDENASCHLALGACYPSNVKGGTELSEEELIKAGGNISMTHCDFMFGSSDMKVNALTFDGKEVTLFENGNFVI